MCGIFGVIATQKSSLAKNEVDKLVNKLFLLSESRGKESSGFALKNLAENKIFVHKKPLAASKLITTNDFIGDYKTAFSKIYNSNGISQNAFALMAHARLVTNGTQDNNNNNQPCIKDDIVCIHNGIITNVDSLWQKYKHLDRKYEVDTELLISIIREKIKQGCSVEQATQFAYSEIKGTASIICQFADLNDILIATNNGSLYYAYNEAIGVCILASESYILKEALQQSGWDTKFGLFDITWLKSGHGTLLNLKEFGLKHFRLKEVDDEYKDLGCEIENVKDNILNCTPDIEVDFSKIGVINSDSYLQKEKKLIYDIDKTKALKRCKKCILPETFPFIHFDELGECNFCKSYRPKDIKGKTAEFQGIVDNYKNPKRQYDCIVPFSGGRDSSYGLHYIVKDLGLRPLTFTYDWGMVTDLARRNIARLCGELGVENIIISADIYQKRENIRKNVEAWLHKPNMGIIPLFMAGDKYFFRYLNVLKKQTGIDLNIWMTNHLEETNFKIGFANVAPHHDKKVIYELTNWQKAKLSFYYANVFLANPKYLNSSIEDTLGAFWSYYIEKRNDYFHLFNYIPWDETQINETLINQYGWELSPDTSSTWRIGDGTAAFYNYIYFTVCGFSEIDTFRSNQIREGMISREEALALSEIENRPRILSIMQYLDLINIDFDKAINIINSIPRRY